MTDTKSIWNRTFFVILMAILCCLLWGSAFPCIKIGYKLFNIFSDLAAAQILFAGIRFALSAFLEYV